MIHMDKPYEMVFGVFNSGETVFLLNKTRCTVKQAGVVVALLNVAKDTLENGDYFACDFVHKNEHGHPTD